MKEARCTHPQCRGPRAVRGLCAFHAFEALRTQNHLAATTQAAAAIDAVRARAAVVGLTLAPALASAASAGARKRRSPVA